MILIAVTLVLMAGVLAILAAIVQDAWRQEREIRDETADGEPWPD